MKNNLKLLAQDFNIYLGDGQHYEARTGAIAIEHIVSAGANGIIIGHSEVNDSPEVLNLKLKNIISKIKSPDFTINLLTGDSWDEFSNNPIEKVAELIVEKCKTIFEDIPAEALGNLIIGYEPKWGSRGSGQADVPPPQASLISTCIKAIKDYIKLKYPNISPSYIYGGSSTPERTLEILQDDNIDGLILGSACNSLSKTIDIVKAMQSVKTNTQNKVLVCNFKAYIISDPFPAYVQELSKLTENFKVYLAPAYTDIRLVGQLIEGEC